MEGQEQVYLQFEAFDFENEDFKNGLENVYESYLDHVNQNNDGKINEIVTEIKPEEKQRLEIQAKTFYFCQQTGNILNIEDYEEWKKTRETAEPEYSSNYQELVELILAGKEIPGIKQIPDTVLEGETTEHKAEVRKKPWEIRKEKEEKARAEAAAAAAATSTESEDKEGSENVKDEDFGEENTLDEESKIAEV